MNKPKHYDPHIDPIAYMKVNMSRGNYEGFLIGNVLKYITRYPKKNGLEDLKKAKDYLNKAIELYEEEENQVNTHNWRCPKCGNSNNRTILQGDMARQLRCSHCGFPFDTRFECK
ncbi:hypothetical protein J32TS2_28480 [Shouchella clausii]|uniref:DUF3310 domain-containing protein n=1 Tax=Shouchella clausii TaxID=79880 RepID=UPI001B058A70|nr:DUF3310 domain-containing protein [Shouchella clausii]GIN17492.1 hypothetical protein J32TS2_28480 [Shouchella clausii]